ncbi:hypothetical protein F2P79_004217 [Pimephales promelas]|nr:hypothetical protein F2P79_004217 [Pimephales promelas]
MRPYTRTEGQKITGLSDGEQSMSGWSDDATSGNNSIKVRQNDPVSAQLRPRHGIVLQACGVFWRCRSLREEIEISLRLWRHRRSFALLEPVLFPLEGCNIKRTVSEGIKGAE